VSKASRRGYEDFDSCTNPLDICPYLSDRSIAMGDYDNYMEGWNKAAKEHEKRQGDKQEELDKFDSLSYRCPWFDNYSCKASGDNCSIDRCAVWFFMENRQ